MAIAITYDGGSISPMFADGFETKRTTRNVVHPILESAAPIVTLRESMLRSGTLNLFFGTDGAAAEFAHHIHCQPNMFILVDIDRPQMNMRYAVSGDVDLILDDVSRNHWTVTVVYQEVAVL